MGSMHVVQCDHHVIILGNAAVRRFAFTFATPIMLVAVDNATKICLFDGLR